MNAESITHVHFCPECNEYKQCVMDCDPVDWLDDVPTHQPCSCDDCAKFEVDPVDIRRRALERTVGTSNFGWFQFHDPERDRRDR